jgi:hypothetical protein
MFRIAVIAYWITANIFLSYAATVHTRDGQLQSGNLGRIDSKGVQIAGKTYKWKDLIRVRLNPGPSVRSGLSEVRTRIWRGNYSNFPDETALNPSSIDNVRRHYLTVRRLGNTPGAILFEGKLNVPRAGNYHFRIGSDDGANLFVGGKAVLSTSAEYSYRRATKSIRLEQGSHAFRLEYLNLASYAILELEWSGPGLPWTALGAVTDLPLPQAPPAIPAAGALAWNGSYIAHPLESLNESRVRFVGNPAGVQLTTVNASAIFFHPLSLPMADRIRSGKVGREGVLLVGGDFQEGEISSIKDNVITLQTLLFGSRKYQGGSQAAAVFLQKPAKLKEQWIVRTQLGTEIRLTKLEWDGSTLVANRTPFRKLRLKSGEIHEISNVTEPNILQRAWEIWTLMDAEHKRQTVAGQGNFDSVFKARSEAKVYLAQLDEKWRRLEKEHVAIQKEVKKILVGLNQQEVSVRKARADLAKSQSNYAVADNWLKVNTHYFNPKLREAHELKVRRLTEVKAALESENKISLATEKRNTEILSKFQAERARQQEQYEKNAKDRNSDYTKVRALFKGDYRPVEVTGATSRDGKVREYSERRRNRARDLLNQYTPARDDARRRRDEAKRRVDAALVQYNARKKQFEQSVAQEADVLRARLKPVEKKVLDLRAEHSVKATLYHELIGKEAAVDQNRLDSISGLQSVDRHLRDWEGQLRSSQGKLRQAEQKKNNALRDHVRRRDLLEAARRTLYEFVDKHELPALQKLNATKVRHDKLVQAVKDNPGQGALVARLSDEQAKMASDLAALTALRGKLNGLIGQYQSKLHDFANHQTNSGRMEKEWKQTQGDIKLLEKFLSSKKARQGELRNITGNLTRQRTDRLNKTHQAKGEMDRAMNALNQALGEHGRRIGEYGVTISRKYEAARHLEDSENTLKREQHLLLQGETLVKLREKEWKRREQIFKKAEAAYVKADRVFKQSEAAKAALRKPLDGDQGKLLGSLEGWLHAQQQVAHYRQETVIELEKMKGEMAVEYLPWAPSITAREVELKRAEAGEKTAADARAKNEKEKETLTQALKHAEVTDKVKQSLQAESIKAMSDASNSLRDARSRVGTKQREWLEAVFQHERYRVQKRVVLGFE